MLSFRFAIDNPFPHLVKKKKWYQKDYVDFDKRITKNRAFCFQISETPFRYTIFSIAFDLNWTGQDHAGPSFDLHVWKWFLHTNLYHRRHWDYEEGRFMTEEEMKNWPNEPSNE